MKRFLALAIAVLMILSFAACASDKSGNSGSTTVPSKPDDSKPSAVETNPKKDNRLC